MENQMVIKRLINKPISSNCFVIYQERHQDCIIIDPGTADNSELTAFLKQRKLQIRFILLTHEHFDHCAGVNALYYVKPFTLLCSEATARGMCSSKSNFSEHFEDVEPFEINLPFHAVYDKDVINFGKEMIRFIKTPGHSPGSICITFGQNVFTGDTLLNYTKTPIKLPGSNKEQYIRSLEKLKTHLKSGMMVYPGHGEAFIYSSDYNQ